MSTGDQFNRKVSLIVSNQTVGVELANENPSEQLHIRFIVLSNDAETPNTAQIKVYNVSEQTTKRIINEFDTVTLQAGYQDSHFGVIFSGTIKQIKKGRERNVDSYIEILAADGDFGYNFGVVNQTFPAGTPPSQELKTLSEAVGLPVDPNADAGLTGGVLLNPRGRVAFGLYRTFMRDFATTHGVRWSIQDGVVTIIPVKGYLPGEAVQINSATGLIGVPESTAEGITVRVLLNPLIKIGGRVQINNKDINTTTVKQQFFPSPLSEPTLVASVTEDGFYRVLVRDHLGDTRGTEWYTNLVCLSLDVTAVPGASVPSF